jgi:hypothetical protein
MHLSDFLCLEKTIEAKSIGDISDQFNITRCSSFTLNTGVDKMREQISFTLFYLGGFERLQMITNEGVQPLKKYRAARGVKYIFVSGSFDVKAKGHNINHCVDTNVG